MNQMSTVVSPSMTPNQKAQARKKRKVMNLMDENERLKQEIKKLQEKPANKKFQKRVNHEI